MAGEARSYEFRRASAGDLELIGGWLRQRHVAKWWRNGDEQLAQIRAHIAGDGTESYVVAIDGRPFGYVQCYATAASPIAVVRSQPAGSRGIDLFIGEPGYLRNGHGHLMLRRFAERLHCEGAPRLVADPDPRNIDAIGCFGRAGFTPAGIYAAAGGKVLLMTRDRDSAGSGD
jgi:aminoglycoside 6'-N-acetyltransferase